MIPLRPLSVAELLDGAVTTIRRYPRQMLIPALIVSLIAFLPLLFWTAWSVDPTVALLSDIEAGVEPTEAEIRAALWAVLLPIGVFIGLTWLANLLLTAMLTTVVSSAVLGRETSIGRSWRQVRPRILRLLSVAVILAVVISAPWLGVVLPVIGGVLTASAALVLIGLLAILPALAATIWLSVRLWLAMPAVVLESDAQGAAIGPVLAVRRSWRLASGAWWRILGVLLLTMILAGAVTAAVNVPASVLGVTIESALAGETISYGVTIVLSTLAGALAQTVTAPFIAAVVALVYVDRRMRTEGLADALAAAALEDPEGPPTA